MSRATKTGTNTWQYRQFEIVRCTHSRTFLGTHCNGNDKTYVRNTLRDVVTDIDCWHWKQWNIKYRADRESQSIIPQTEKGTP